MKYPQEVMDVMAQAIKTGIHDAKKTVEDQANADYTVDSIVRKVPIFGSVYGWLLPDNDPNDIDDITNNTGVGFELGVGITKPQIVRTNTPTVEDTDVPHYKYPTTTNTNPDEVAENNNNETNDNQ
eukprot:CAMPEP_0201596478 /NCGR_PEP_ID=MMETSP0190_2-20130828/193156_1 /ASSEMBLY_ACC=CAM_ASM_000263 /TAXON_ID=37353 /ORGANISM="Rosalina sp." /LENGTH=125 /DNA_ID=CAMNT_0048056851 /DNA_START=672 /DNA_END=1049 /DNA_ORIENTATION=-